MTAVRLHKGAVQPPRDLASFESAKELVSNAVPSAISNSSPAWAIFNAGAVEAGAFCVDDGQVIPLEKLQDPNGGAGTITPIVRVEINSSRNSPSYNELGPGKICSSFYVRAAGLSYVATRLVTDGNKYDRFDLVTGSFIEGHPDTVCYINPVEGGYRIEVVWDWALDPDDRVFFYVYLSEDGSQAGNVDNDGTSSLWLGGFQIEAAERASKLLYNRNHANPLNATRVFGGNVVYLHKGAVQPARETGSDLGFHRPLQRSLQRSLQGRLQRNLG